MDERPNEHCRESADDLRSLARELVRIPTENPPGEEKPAAVFVSEWFRARGIDAELLDEPDADRPQVGARVEPEETDGARVEPEETDGATADPNVPTVVLNGHLDVVPAGDRGPGLSPLTAARSRTDDSTVAGART